MSAVLRGGLALAGVAFAVVAYRVQVTEIHSPGERALAVVTVALAFLAAGLAAWSRRPGNRLGPLMILTAFLLFARQLRYSSDPALFTVFFATGDLAYVLVGHSVLAYPAGRIVDRLERAVIATAYATVVLFSVAILLVYDATGTLRQMGPLRRESLLLVWGNAELAARLQDVFIVVFYGGLAGLLVALIARRLWRAGPRGRRILAPLLLAAVALVGRSVLESVYPFFDVPLDGDYLFWWQIVGFIALPGALFLGLLRARLAQATVGDLVVELEHAPPHALREALARSLGDPTLQVGFWLPERREYVDAAGAPLPLPLDDPRRAVTQLGDGDRRVAVLVHDPSLLDEPELVSAAGAAARLALENARLHAEVQAQLAHVRDSRGRIAAAADEERRRIERDLHDGAQQRLVALALELRSAQRALGASSADVGEVLGGAVTELQVAVEELRELAHGVHPPILTQSGLKAALEDLADRTPFPVAVVVQPERLPAHVESALYFVVCEAVANVVKHAGASSASIDVQTSDGTVVVEVVDDGRGGADARAGSGLRGLADRVEAHGGRLTVDSRPGGGTRLRAELPLS